MIPETRATVRRSFGARAEACSIAIKSIRADKRLSDHEKTYHEETLRQSQEAWARMADPSVAGRIADILNEGMT